MVRTEAVIYTRASKDKTGAGLSVTGQAGDCRTFARNHNLAVRQVFTDNDITASGKKRRPGYLAMLAYLADHPGTTVIVWHTDRLHRHMAELEHYIQLAQDHDVITRAVQAGDLDLATASGRMVARIVGATARHELEHMSERRKAGKARAAAAGHWRGGRRPFGYARDGVTVVPEEAGLIASATEAILAGASVASVVRAWKAAGSRGSSGGPWNIREVSNVLRRPRNAGLIEHQGQVLEGVRAEWPPIVEESLWRGVCALLSDPGRRTSPGPERRWLLSGIAECGICGTGLIVSKVAGKGRTPRPVYRCRPPDAAGSFAHVARDVISLDEYVTVAALAWLEKPEAALALRPVAQSAAPLQVRAAALRQRLNQAADMFAKGQIDAAQLAVATNQLNAEMAGINRRLAEVGQHDRLAAFSGRDPAEVWAGLDLDRQRAVLQALMKRLVVNRAPRGRPPGWRAGKPYFDADSVEIHWNQ
jgi:site-specific DNA recombinase